MERVFPLGLPVATQTYLVLYVVTLVIHFLLAGYVLAGSAWLVVERLIARRRPVQASRRVVPDIVADWLPFALGAAITAGVAPLLFIQILYKQSFYTANLLLFHRWMILLPVLIVGFYLLYLGKTPRMATLPRGVQLLVRLVALACFLFTGWSWTENHLLSLDREVWPAFYASSRWVYTHSTEWARCAVWLCAALPTMGMPLAWQLRDRRIRRGEDTTRDVRMLAAASIVSLLLLAASLAWYRAVLPGDDRASLAMPVASVYLWIGPVALGLQLVGWVVAFFARRLTPIVLGAVTAGVVGFVLSAVVLREVLRLGAADLEVLVDMHERASRVGGLIVFLLFFVLNAALITGCVVLVRRGLAADAAREWTPEPQAEPVIPRRVACLCKAEA